MEDFYDKVNAFKKSKKLNNKDLGEVIDISGDAFRMAINRKSLSSLQIKELERFFVSHETDETLSVKVIEPVEQLINKTGNVFEELKTGKFRIWTKKLPVKAFGSYLSEFRNASFIEDLEDVPWIVDHFARGRYVTFETEGDSMNGGGIDDTPANAEMLCRELLKHHWKDGFYESKYGWVIVHKDTVLFKDITDFNTETGDIICHSRSGLPNHPDFPVNLNDVLEIWKVIKRSF